MYNIGDILVMDDDKEYIVTNKIEHENKIYYFIMNFHNNNDFDIVYEDGISLIEVTKNSLEILRMFNQNEEPIKYITELNN